MGGTVDGGGGTQGRQPTPASPVNSEQVDWTSWLELMESAQRLAQQYRVPETDSDQILNECIDESPDSPAQSVAVRLRRLFASKAKARQRSRKRLQTGAADTARSRSIPRLCPCLASLAQFHREPRRLLAVLLALTGRVAHEPKALGDHQLRAFLLAYEDGIALPRMVEILGAPTSEAMVERLRRISARLERTVARRLSDVLASTGSRRLAIYLDRGAKGVTAEKKRTDDATSSLATLSEQVHDALCSLLAS